MLSTLYLSLSYVPMKATPGISAPLGFFDPLQITQNCDDSTLKYLRESEIHHGRIAMIANLMLPSIDYFNKEQN